MLIPSHLIYVLKREISSVPQLHKTSPCFSSQLGLCCLPDTWQKVHATQLLPVCHKIWKTRESHCPATILPTIAWPRSAFAAEYCPDRSSPLNKKKKKKETGYRLPHVKSYTKSETILHQCWSAAVQIFCHQYPTSSAADAETVLAAGENPELQNKLKSQSKWGYNHGSLIIHYYKPLISLCLSFTAWVLNIYFWCT